jgi:predicted acetyltransferase
MDTPSWIRHIGSAALEDGDLRLQFFEFAPNLVHKVPTYRFRMLHAGTAEELGGINLRIASTPHIELYAGHIGYTVYPAHRGHRYAARSIRLLAPIARYLHLEVLWITCDPGNAASRRSAELAGAEFIEIVDVPENCIIHQSGHKRKCRYRLDLRSPTP